MWILLLSGLRLAVAEMSCLTLAGVVARGVEPAISILSGKHSTE